MKKLLLFVAVATLGLTSCSSDDDKGGNGSGNSTLTVTIDGVAKTFNTIVVNENTYEEDGGWTELEVTATINNNPSEIIFFELEKGDLGASAIYYFTYTKDGVNYYGDNVSSVVQTNNSGKLKGSFSGTFSRWSNETQQNIEIQLTNGSFDISY